MNANIAIITITGSNQALWVDAVRELFLEYQQQLGVDLCFQGFSEELARLPGDYLHSARGALYLATDGTTPLACGAFRACASLPRAAEMKRLYVRDRARGTQLGRRLAQRIIDDARAAGHAQLVLDTLPGMATAQRLYESLGFTDLPAYYGTPLAGTRFMGLTL